MKENETEQAVKESKSKSKSKKPKAVKDKPAKREKPQPDLPAMTGKGVEEISIPAIDNAAETYREAKKAAKAAKKEMDAAENGLLMVVLENEDKLVRGDDGNKTYRYEDHLVVLKPQSSRVGVKDIKVEMSVGEV